MKRVLTHCVWVAVFNPSLTVPIAEDDELLPLGSECHGDCQCATDHCYNYDSVNSPQTPGECRCDPMTNAGCADNQICSDIIEGDIGVEPECFASVGSQKSENISCHTGNSHNGICLCLPALDFHNFGCPQGEYCTSDDGASGRWNSARCETRKPMGQPCNPNGHGHDCQSRNCQQGICACSLYEDESGCQDGMTCLWSGDDDLEYPVECKKRFPLGEDCGDPKDCETGICFEGKCQCSQDLGCPNEYFCIGSTYNDIHGWEGPFQCQPRRMPGMECNSSYAYFRQCYHPEGRHSPCINGICQNPEWRITNCPSDLISTLSDEEPLTEPYTPTETTLTNPPYWAPWHPKEDSALSLSALSGYLLSVFTFYNLVVLFVC